MIGRSIQKVSKQILKKPYWKSLTTRSAAYLQDSLKAHAEMFHLLKSPRKLKYQTALGIVKLELAIGPNLLGTPLQAHRLLSTADIRIKQIQPAKGIWNPGF